MLFPWAFPERRERQGLLALLHELRSLAHVLDMQQLTKEPGRLRPDYTPTPRSLPSDLDAGQMQDYRDVETLTSEISTKIYQKVALLRGLGRV